LPYGGIAFHVDAVQAAGKIRSTSNLQPISCR
jgi:cysteine sulfinate desulfinase/cysteine desulfurase-like protein